jgi:hypothetical protein
MCGNRLLVWRVRVKKSADQEDLFSTVPLGRFFVFDPGESPLVTSE